MKSLASIANDLSGTSSLLDWIYVSLRFTCKVHGDSRPIHWNTEKLNFNMTLPVTLHFSMGKKKEGNHVSKKNGGKNDVIQYAAFQDSEKLRNEWRHIINILCQRFLAFCGVLYYKSQTRKWVFLLQSPSSLELSHNAHESALRACCYIGLRTVTIAYGYMAVLFKYPYRTVMAHHLRAITNTDYWAVGFTAVIR